MNYRRSRWFLATDERDPSALDYARARGAVFISDLLFNPQFVSSTPCYLLQETSLRRLEDWPLLYTDVLSILEQSVMARAGLFSAQGRSSVSGGVVNLRGARGMDVRTIITDG